MSSDSTKQNVLIVGSGGVGTMAAYALENGGKAEVTTVLRSNFDIVTKFGFTIDSVDHGGIKDWKPTRILKSIPDVSKENLTAYDVVIVSTKNIPDVPPTVSEIIAPAITPGYTTIMLLQNGLFIENPVIEAFPKNPVLSGISMIGACEGPHGFIKHDDHDILIVGAFVNPNIPAETSEAAAKSFVDIYGASPGVKCTYEPDVAFWRWRKLLYNSSFNTVSTILGLDATRMRYSEHVVDNLLRPVMLEIIAAARAYGVQLPEELVEQVITVDPWAAFLKPSMMQDAEKGNLIEYENIVGEPLRAAEKAGVPVPTLKVVYGILKGLQWKTLEAKGLVKVPTQNEPGLKYGNK